MGLADIVEREDLEDAVRDDDRARHRRSKFRTAWHDENHDARGHLHAKPTRRAHHIDERLTHHPESIDAGEILKAKLRFCIARWRHVAIGRLDQAKLMSLRVRRSNAKRRGRHERHIRGRRMHIDDACELPIRRRDCTSARLHMHIVRHIERPGLAIKHERIPRRLQRHATCRMAQATKPIGHIKRRVDVHIDRSRRPRLDRQHPIASAEITCALRTGFTERDDARIHDFTLNLDTRIDEATVIRLTRIDPTPRALAHHRGRHRESVGVEPEAYLALSFRNLHRDRHVFFDTPRCDIHRRAHDVALGPEGMRERGCGRESAREHSCTCHPHIGLELRTMPHIDLTIPIAILGVAFINVLLIRAYAAWGNRRIEERTDAWLAEGRAERKAEGPRDAKRESEEPEDLPQGNEAD